MSHLEMMGFMFDLGTQFTNATIHHPKFRALLRSNAKFYAVIVEVFLTDALFATGAHFGAPVIGLSTFGASKWSTELVGTPIIPSFVPHTFSPFTDHMTFFERLGNFAMYWMDELTMPFFYDSIQEKIYKEGFPNSAKASLAEIKANTSLVLLNTHVSLGFPRPYATNMIEVGGMHVNPKVEKLPQDLQAYLDGAKDGAVYFSMCSNIKATQFPPEKLAGIIETFKSFPKVKFLFKYEAVLANKPDNVLTKDWFPQESVLNHPNVKLFITHGGLLSTTESIHFGKPVVGIPVFGDQSLNIGYAERRGYGIMVDFHDLSHETLTNAVNKGLNDPQ